MASFICFCTSVLLASANVLFVVKYCLWVAPEPKNHSRHEEAVTGSFHFQI